MKQPTTRWKKGTPPKPGWYHASEYRNPVLYRWWNGECWSLAAMEGESIHEVARSAYHQYPTSPKYPMYWKEIKL
jgi:hypothetical protein